MQVLKEVTDADLDHRMSGETRAFITKFLTAVDPRAIVQLPLSVVRETRENNSKLMNGALQVKNVELKEFLVKSLVDGFEIPVTAYVPSETTPGSPLVVFYHGGGWTFCSRNTHHFAVSLLAEASKCIWLSVEYRLAPEFKHPVGLDDCLSVTKWAVENKVSLFNLSPDAEVGVSGDSAGGNYAATIAHEMKNEIHFQMLVYPCVDLKLKTQSGEEFVRDCHVLIPEALKFFGNNVLNSDEDLKDPRISPILFPDFKNLPKAFILAAELDPLLDHSKIYQAKLAENDISCELHVIKGVHHGFFNSPPFFPVAFKETIEHFVNFLNKLKK